MRQLCIKGHCLLIPNSVRQASLNIQAPNSKNSTAGRQSLFFDHSWNSGLGILELWDTEILFWLQYS